MVFSWSPAGLIWLPSSSRDTGIIDGNRGKQVLLFVGSWGVGETILSKVTFLVWDSWDMGWWLQDHPLWQDLKLDKIQQFVLDECDKCLDKVDMRKDGRRFAVKCGIHWTVQVGDYTRTSNRSSWRLPRRSRWMMVDGLLAMSQLDFGRRSFFFRSCSLIHMQFLAVYWDYSFAYLFIYLFVYWFI